MRTTMNLPDALMAEVKARAARDGRTVTSLVEEALRVLVYARPDAEPDLRLTSYGAPGGELLVDIADKEALWAVLDAPE